MAITKSKKAEIITGRTTDIKGALSAAIVSFTKLTVAEVNEMRAAFKKEGVKYTVVKKSLLKRALADAGVTGDVPDMPGEIAIALMDKSKGDDITTPARTLQVFVKKFKDKLAFVGGVVDGTFMAAKETVALATIPPTPVLRGMFVNIINSPIQRFAIALGEVAKTKPSA